MSRMLIIVLLLFMNSTVIKTAYAGIYIEEKISTTIPGKEFAGIKKTYITEAKALIIDPTIPLKQIFDFTQEKVYLIDDTKKTLAVKNLSEFSPPLNEDIYMDFVSLSDYDFYSKESGSIKKIGRYNCYELVVYIPRIAAFSRLWLTSEVEPELAVHFKFIKNSQDILHKRIMSMRKETNLYVIESKTLVVRPDEPEKYLKIKLIKISSHDIPEDMFSLPVDYTAVR